MKTDDTTDLWLPVVARVLGYMVVQSSDLREKGLADKAKILQNLGFPRREIATLLDTSEDSIRGLLRYAGKSKAKKDKRIRSPKK